MGKTGVKKKKKMPHDEILRYNAGLKDFKLEKTVGSDKRRKKTDIFKDSSTVDATQNRKSLPL